ncbi:SPOC domain-like protein, partial [Atractiella rhizophila]
RLAKVEADEDGDQGDDLTALICAIETLTDYVGTHKKKKTIVIVTDGLSDIDWSAEDVVVKQLLKHSIELVVIGVDFDDPDVGFKEEDKPELRAKNEDHYRNLVSQLPDSLVATAEEAYMSSQAPKPKVTDSRPLYATLRLGDPEKYPDDSLELKLSYYKATSKATPLSWKKMSMRGYGQQDTDEPRSFAVNRETKYFYAPQPVEKTIESLLEKEGMEAIEEEDIMEAEAESKELEVVPEEKKESLVKAYKYGSTLVPFRDEEDLNMLQLPGAREGIEIVGFMKERSLDRAFAMGEVYRFFGSDNYSSVAFSAFLNALSEDGRCALVRWTKKYRDRCTDPKIGVLLPRVEGELEYALYVRVPFAEDVKKHFFPSLTTIKNRVGEALTEHKYLPTTEQCETMDNFVQAMDLMDADVDADGAVCPWFDVSESFSPSIHHVKNAVLYRLANPDDETLPIVHPTLSRYFNIPGLVEERADPHLQKLKELFEVKQVPPKMSATRKKAKVNQEVDDEEIDLDDILGTAGEDEDVGMQDVSQVKANELSKDEGLISLDDPMKDWQEIVGAGKGDLVSGAVKSMMDVIPRIVKDASRSAEAINCLEALRETCASEDEIDTFNNWIPSMLDKLQTETTATSFLKKMKQQGLGLITRDMVTDEGSRDSAATESAAKKFLSRI